VAISKVAAPSALLILKNITKIYKYKTTNFFSKEIKIKYNAIQIMLS